MCIHWGHRTAEIVYKILLGKNLLDAQYRQKQCDCIINYKLLQTVANIDSHEEEVWLLEQLGKKQ